jgi:hypothetical protein
LISNNSILTNFRHMSSFLANKGIKCRPELRLNVDYEFSFNPLSSDESETVVRHIVYLSRIFGLYLLPVVFSISINNYN